MSCNNFEATMQSNLGHTPQPRHHTHAEHHRYSINIDIAYYLNQNFLLSTNHVPFLAPTMRGVRFKFLLTLLDDADAYPNPFLLLREETLLVPLF